MSSPKQVAIGPIAELLSFIEEDAMHWEMSASMCEDCIAKIPASERKQMALNSSVFRERAALHWNLVAAFKRRFEV